MNRLLLALLVCAACRHTSSSSSETHTEATSTTETRTEESGSQTTTTVVTEAPGTTTTTVSEYTPPAPEPEPAEAPDGGMRPAPKLPRHGPLVRRTVTVASHGQEITETHQQASAQGSTATEVKAQAKGDTKAQSASQSAPAASCVSLGWLWGAIVLVALLGIGYFALKMRRAIP